jgi:hypothetical protein
MAREEKVVERVDEDEVAEEPEGRDLPSERARSEHAPSIRGGF